MSIKIGSNLASLNAQRRLGDATTSLSSIYEKLSSGQRINRASDDAAGLAIADELKAKGRVYTQAIRNGNDGISLLNIADSAIDALSGVVTRIRELSEQAANGTYSNQQRAALDAEAQALSKEFTRITQSTSFNGIKIFDGSLGSGVRLQLGNGITESINASVGGAIGTGGFLSTQVYTTATSARELVAGDFNNDGLQDYLQSSGSGALHLFLGDGNGQFLSAITVSNSISFSDIKAADLNSDGILDLVNSVSGGAISVRLGIGGGTFSEATSFSDGQSVGALALADINSDGNLDLISSIVTNGGSVGRISVRMGLGDGSFASSQTFSSNMTAAEDMHIADFNNDNYLDVALAGQAFGTGGGKIAVLYGEGSGSFSSSTVFSADPYFTYALEIVDINNDSHLDIVTAGSDRNDGDPAGAYNTVIFGSAIGITSQAVRYGLGDVDSSHEYFDLALHDINYDGYKDILSVGASNFNTSLTVRYGKQDGSFSDAVETTGSTYNSTKKIIKADYNSDGVLDFITVGESLSIGSRQTLISSTEDGLGAILDFSLKTKSDALQSMGMLETTLENLAKQRGTIGASQSRVNIAISNLQTAKENFAAAESRIRDADVAAEAANLVRTQILQQAASSVLSQANQQPQLALQLLR